ncbi:zeta toxin family protein [uncultured Chryseobacterium sp.]|uniref:zeta toxin family protein n=1 Tax=uncultured Chryseobacterium sp. TaxID=259322 RepID=UPI0027DD404C|nr:zeta toxin family protein [uncultured Chryseobacterium sp.]
MKLHPYLRKLDNIDLIEHFLETVINYEDSSNNTILHKIKSGEAELKNYIDSKSTLASTENRNRQYKNNRDRWELRKQIVTELITLKREDDDDNISLGVGGTLPNCGLLTEKKAVIIIGLPASGKSTIANTIADSYGAIILDSDFAKRKIPEYVDNPAGASLVHEESDYLVFGANISDKPNDFKCLFEKCIEKNFNIVIPKIGHDHKKINDLSIALTKLAYEVHLVCVSLDRRLATQRAIGRFIKTNRYVPLSLVFDGYGNDCILTFYRLKDRIGIDDDVPIKSFGKLSTNVPHGSNPIILYSEEDSPVEIFR